MVWAQFMQTHQKVSVFVGDIRGQTESVTLDALDSGGHVIPGASSTQQLSQALEHAGSCLPLTIRMSGFVMCTFLARQ